MPSSRERYLFRSHCPFKYFVLSLLLSFSLKGTYQLSLSFYPSSVCFPFSFCFSVSISLSFITLMSFLCMSFYCSTFLFIVLSSYCSVVLVLSFCFIYFYFSVFLSNCLSICLFSVVYYFLALQTNHTTVVKHKTNTNLIKLPLPQF